MQAKEPILKKGWQRVLLFLVSYLILVFASSQLVLYWRLLEPGNANDKVAEIYSSIVVNFIIGTVLVLLLWIGIDQKPLHQIGFQWNPFATERWIGLMLGIFLCCGIATVFWLMKLVRWYNGDAELLSFLQVTGLLVLVATGEELMFRGYILQNLMQSMNLKTALFVSAFLFSLFHSLNPEMNLSSFLTILLAGLLLGMNFLFTKNLWFGIAFHFFWNWIQGPVLGFQVSGLNLPALLEADVKGSVLLTGGSFGLEASWLTILFLGTAIVLLYPAFEKRYRPLSHK